MPLHIYLLHGMAVLTHLRESLILVCACVCSFVHNVQSLTERFMRWLQTFEALPTPHTCWAMHAMSSLRDCSHNLPDVHHTPTTVLAAPTARFSVSLVVPLITSRHLTTQNWSHCSFALQRTLVATLSQTTSETLSRHHKNVSTTKTTFSMLAQHQHCSFWDQNCFVWRCVRHAQEPRHEVSCAHGTHTRANIQSLEIFEMSPGLNVRGLEDNGDQETKLRFSKVA